MKRILITFSLFFATLLFSARIVSARSLTLVPSPTPSPIPTSYELFWPLSPGVTVGEPTFFLKELKEKFSGFLIIGNARKGEYELMLASKRFLEAEKLAKDGKNGLSDKSLEKASERVKSSKTFFEKALGKGEIPEVKDETVKKINNLVTFSPVLSGLTDDSGDKKIETINSILKDILALVMK